MKPCCGNCKHWKETRTTVNGKLAYFGKCDVGRPFKQGQTFTRKGTEFKYCDFTIRNDKCKDWEEKE